MLSHFEKLVSDYKLQVYIRGFYLGFSKCWKSWTIFIILWRIKRAQKKSLLFMSQELYAYIYNYALASFSLLLSVPPLWLFHAISSGFCYMRGLKFPAKACSSQRDKFNPLVFLKGGLCIQKAIHKNLASLAKSNWRLLHVVPLCCCGRSWMMTL